MVVVGGKVKKFTVGKQREGPHGYRDKRRTTDTLSCFAPGAFYRACHLDLSLSQIVTGPTFATTWIGASGTWNLLDPRSDSATKATNNQREGKSEHVLT